MTYRNKILDDGLNDNKKDFLSFLQLPPYVEFLIISSLVLLLFILYGYFLELLFKVDGMRDNGWFLTLVQFGFYVIFALCQIKLFDVDMERRIPVDKYFVISFLTVGTMGFSNSSMGFLNYPTQVLFKSCKLIPVMIGSMILLKKEYNVVQILAVLLMSAGLIWFTLADSIVQPTFEIKGIILISLALLCDALIGNVQEKYVKLYNESTVLVVLYSYAVGFLMILIGLTFNNTLFSAISFSVQNAKEFFIPCTLLSLCGYFGVQLVLELISRYGAVVAVTVTTLRKIISICLSFFFFAKPFTFHYLLGGSLVGIGVYLSVIGKQRMFPSVTSFAFNCYLLVRNKLYQDKHSKDVLLDV